MSIYPKIFDSLEQAILFAKKLERSLPEDNTRGALPPTDKFEYLFNPYSGFENNAPEDKFIVCRLESGRFSLKPNLHGHRFLYRGQEKFYKYCAPSLFRDRNKNYFLEEMVRAQEQQWLMLSHPLVRLLDHGIELGNYPLVFEINLCGLTQHYYNKTWFMDLTSDIQVAAFFASNKYDSNTDTYIPKAEGIGCLYLYELKEGIDFKIPHLSTIGLQIFPRSGAQRGFLYDMEIGQNFNDLTRLKVLKFRHHRNISDKYNKMFDGGSKLFPDDILTHHWREYNKASKRLSQLAVRYNAYVNRHKNETEKSIVDKLEKLGYTIQDYEPSFTLDELHDFYFSCPHYWEDFCEPIYFPGDRKEELHQQLVEVKNRPEYRWAFDEDSFRMTDLSKIHGYLYDKYQKAII